MLAELLLKQPVFAGRSEVEQLHAIFKVLGAPRTAISRRCPSRTRCSISASAGRRIGCGEVRDCDLRQHGHDAADRAGLDLLQRLFAYDPSSRLGAAQAASRMARREAPFATPRRYMKLRVEKKVGSVAPVIEPPPAPENRRSGTSMCHSTPLPRRHPPPRPRPPAAPPAVAQEVPRRRTPPRDHEPHGRERARHAPVGAAHAARLRMTCVFEVPAGTNLISSRNVRMRGIRKNMTGLNWNRGQLSGFHDGVQRRVPGVAAIEQAVQGAVSRFHNVEARVS